MSETACIGIPLIAALAFITLIGIPLSIGLLVFLLPALWFLGYLVVGTKLGSAILSAFGRASRDNHPYLEALIGLVILQAIILVPFVGWLVFILSGLWGAGALALVAWNSWRGTGTTPRTPAPTASL